tara:strand:- start:12300 stop:12659 length:360 start_codon:yes stop_codon:yes gene_type:complete
MIKTIKRYLNERKTINKLRRDNAKLITLLNDREKSIIQSFQDGSANTWTFVQVCLYDMYKNMEILDYASLVKTMASRLAEYDINEQVRQEKIEQFNNDLKIRDAMINGDDSDDDDSIDY